MRRYHWLLLALLAVPASAALIWGGIAEDGFGLFGPATSNRAPRFSSASTANIPENSAGTIYSASASDPDGDAISLTVSGGPDAARFAITDDGALRFARAPNFEAPEDADGDNIYELEIAANDGDAVTRLPLRLTVVNQGNDEFVVRRVGAGFGQPLFVAPVPDGTGRVFVVQKGGRILILDPDTGQVAPTAFLNVSSEINTNSERGLLGFATAPDFATTGVFYVYLINLAGDSEIRRYRTQTGNRDRADPASANVILSFDQPETGNHKGGWLGFDPNGLLYLASGDGGGGGDPNNTAQNRDLLLGKIIRIDPDGDDFPGDPLRDYAIPPDNSFANGGGRPEIWALGLRNPFRCSFDFATGRLYIGDVGQRQREELNLMAPDDGGANFGWSIFEGTLRFKSGSKTGLVPPILEYTRGEGLRQGNSVTGGYVYRGPVEALQGLYFFADFGQPNVWTVPITAFDIGVTRDKSVMTNRNAELRPDVGTINLVASFGEDEERNLYIVGIDGEIFRIEAR